jgi:hypothetical protein
MKNSTKNKDVCGQMRRCCEEMARGFALMEAAEEITPDTWGEAVNALAETLAVARVNWAELAAERASPPEIPAGCSYSVQLLDAAGESMAGASFAEPSDEAAEDEARALALLHDWCVRARLRAKGTVQCRACKGSAEVTKYILPNVLGPTKCLSCDGTGFNSGREWTIEIRV